MKRAERRQQTVRAHKRKHPASKCRNAKCMICHSEKVMDNIKPSDQRKIDTLNETLNEIQDTMEDKIPTAEEFLENKACVWKDGEEVYADYVSPAVLIAFTKLHVKAALEAAAENAKIINDPTSYTGNTGSEYPPDQIISKESILNSYPDEKIL